MYTLVGEKVWSYVGPLSPKDKTQLEERLRRVSGPSSVDQPETPATPAPAAGVSRLANAGIARPGSPSLSKLTRPDSPARALRPASPAISHHTPDPPVRARAESTASNGPASPTGITRPKTLLPSRLARPRAPLSQPTPAPIPVRQEVAAPYEPEPEPAYKPKPSRITTAPSTSNSHDSEPSPRVENADDITLTISSILSSDPLRSVDALKKIQKILSVSPEAGPSSPQYRELAEHTEGLIETITLQMAHAFDNPDNLLPDDNFRLAKHLIQTLNNFCDHTFLAESLTVEILTSLLEELTLRLLETDDNPVKKIKDLSRFINMIILRLFATGRRMSVFR